MKSNKHSMKAQDKKGSCFLTILKYTFALVFPMLAVFVNKLEKNYLLLAFAEILLIALLTNILCRTKYFIAYIFNSLSLFLINLQFGFLFFGNSFVSMGMLENTDSIKDLWGKFIYYGIAIVFLLFFSFAPIRRFNINALSQIGVGFLVVIVYAFILLTNQISFSPIYNTYSLCQQQIKKVQIQKAVNNNKNLQNEFKKDEIEDYISKPENIKSNPNVILIFTEGLSENVIEDNRNVTPNIKALEKKSISFKNYYNHTFATYMALSGQLYSGYQQNNYDVNNLISIQDIFKEYGYDTAFINTEPKNKEFTEYLNKFGFDTVISDASNTDGMADSISDKSAYNLLLKTAESKNESNQPFFISMYSFGTHTSLNGVYNKFGKGNNNFLNRFYDLDIQVGKFIKNFEKSDLFDNTILIFTADHCSYQDTDFSNAYPNYYRKSTVLDRIPLMIYYKGVTSASYDVSGRNSLDMAPTVLDFLDMSAPNCFLGESLFSPDGTDYDTYFQSYSTYFNTKNNKINGLQTEETYWFEDEIIKYFACKLK